MRRALLIPEILHHVCAHASDAARLYLALSCKAFHETAIRLLLWSDLHDLSPPIKCLPEDAWTTGEETGELVSTQPAPNLSQHGPVGFTDFDHTT